MIHPGLVSITLRQFSADELIKLAVEAGLEGIEWGGDIHVPHGDLIQAEKVRKITQRAGLQVVSYGSYYRLGEEEKLPFEKVLKTAVKLGTPSIRVWAGRKESDKDVHSDYFDLIVDESRRIAELASDAGIVVVYEFHRGTLTGTNVLTQTLLETVSHDNIKTLWQPTVALPVKYCLEGLELIMPWLNNVHVFHWNKNADIRYPLADGESVWSAYLEKINTSGRNHFAMLEFVKDDDPANVLQDAKTLKAWLSILPENHD